jgi:hypothetical protein
MESDIQVEVLDLEKSPNISTKAKNGSAKSGS